MSSINQYLFPKFSKVLLYTFYGAYFAHTDTFIFKYINLYIIDKNVKYGQNTKPERHNNIFVGKKYKMAADNIIAYCLPLLFFPCRKSL